MGLYERLFDEVVTRLRGALSRALPGYSPRELYWRIHFLIGLMVHPLMAGDKLARYTEELCTFDNPAELTERMVKFAAAGMRSPAPGTPGSGPGHGDGQKR